MALTLRAATTALALVLLGAAPAAADCPGSSTPECPYAVAGQVGQRADGILRFPQALAVGPDGTVWVGDQGSHVVQGFAPDGTVRAQLGIAGTRRGELTSVGALAVAGDGSVLVADGSNRIVRFAPDGSVLAEWGKAGSGVGEFRFGGGRGNDAGAGGGLAVGGQAVYVADSGNDRIQRFDLEGGHGAEIVPPGTLGNPKGLAVRGSRLFVADDQHHRLLVMDTGGKLLRVVGGAGTGPGQLNFPYGVALDAQGRLFAADNLNHRVVRYSDGPDYPYKSRWGAYGSAPGRLAYPRGLAIGPTGEVFVANTGNDRIDVFDRTGALLRSFGRSGRTEGQFGTPLGVMADAEGVRAVADSVNGRIQLLAPDGGVRTSWGSPAPGPTVLPRPVAVAFDSAGDAYVLDQRRARIVVFSRATGLPRKTIATQGSGPGKLLDPSALWIDGNDRILVGDTGNGRIVRFGTDGGFRGQWELAGAVRGIAANADGSRVYAVDARNRITVRDGVTGDEITSFGGTGTKVGKLSAAGQMAVDAGGTLWVTDRGANRVQRFGPDGERLGWFGERGTGPGQFLRPTGIAVDCNGLLTVSDADGGRVQQFALTTPAVAPCRPLTPLGSPPPPQLPTLPAPDGPVVTVRALRTAGLIAARNLPVRVGCDTSCAATLTVRLTGTKRAPKKRKPFELVLAAVKGDVAGGESKVLRALMTARQAASLKGVDGLAATVQVTATAAVGAPTTQSLRLRVGG